MSKLQMEHVQDQARWGLQHLGWGGRKKTRDQTRCVNDGTTKSAVYEGVESIILVDQCIPTRAHFKARRPDLVV